MRIGGALALIAIGAILRFAVQTTSTHGVNIHTTGVILMIIGLVGLIAEAIYQATRRRTVVQHRGPVAPEAYVDPRDVDRRY